MPLARRFLCIFSFLLTLCVVSSPSNAQDSDVLLLADTITLTPEGNLVAGGQVEIFHEGQELRTSKLIYMRDSETIFFPEGAHLLDENGDSFIASSGELSRDLSKGIVKGAKSVINQQLEMQSEELERENRIATQFRGVRATACTSCTQTTPIWQIRARSGFHDREKQQIFFNHAHLRIFNIPVFYTPYLRLPEPSVKRMRGFLVPRARQSSLWGLGLELPYFIPIGPDKDITLTPLWSQDSQTLKIRYRQALDRGNIDADFAISKDQIKPDIFRGRLSVNGKVDLNKGYKLSFGSTVFSDDTYGSDYGYGSSNRLESKADITKTNKSTYQESRLSYYHALYENIERVPTVINYNEFERNFKLSGISGRFTASGILHINYRHSDIDQDARDTRRLNTSLKWQDQFVSQLGVSTTTKAQLRADNFVTVQDTRYEQTQNRLAADANVVFRWPLVMQTQSMARSIIAPTLQFAFSRQPELDLPLEESTHSNFDEGNLLALSRFPALDRFENDLRGAVGLSYHHQFKNKAGLTLSFGKVFRQKAEADLTSLSGLDGTVSDLMISASYKNATGLSIMGRGLIDEDTETPRADLLTSFAYKKFDISSAYSLLPESTEENREDRISDLALSVTYRANSNWRLSQSARYDLEDGRTVSLGFATNFDNECTTASFSLNRSFGSGASAEDVTTWDFMVNLKGFSTGGDRNVVKSGCTE